MKTPLKSKVLLCPDCRQDNRKCAGADGAVCQRPLSVTAAELKTAILALDKGEATDAAEEYAVSLWRQLQTPHDAGCDGKHRFVGSCPVTTKKAAQTPATKRYTEEDLNGLDYDELASAYNEVFGRYPTTQPTSLNRFGGWCRARISEILKRQKAVQA